MSATTASTHAPAGTWSVDRARSRVAFAVKQLGLSDVRGRFGELEGTLELGDDLAEARVHGSVTVASLDTENKRRDAHLRSPAFFDAERHPSITFRSSTIRRLDSGALEISGDLTIHGQTRPITLTADVRATEERPGGDRRLALAVRGRLNRRDYGVSPSPLLSAVVSDEVELLLDISAVERA